MPSYNGYCCPEGTQYSYSETEGHKCTNISITNCAQVNCTYTNN